MAITARISSGTTIGGAALQQRTRTSIVSRNFDPKPNVSLTELNDVITTDVQDGYALVYDSATGQFRTQQIEAVASIAQLTGGTF